MRKPWKDRLLKACRKLWRAGDRPIWWDGFCDVLICDESSSIDDNPYLPKEESLEHTEYKAGAKAAESLKRYIAARGKAS